MIVVIIVLTINEITMDWITTIIYVEKFIISISQTKEKRYFLQILGWNKYQLKRKSKYA